ncbi:MULTISPECIES: NAD(P)/FAD-dependent oxidoreductase [Mycolicibacterium]|uniref:FAD-dependent pyridine nucleotide-disulfide oxidoreductase n=1 Tax=Mycolicibacterium senegalense TaxID=1796 RepID=A0A378W6A3_9MYCO|nr:MULTISPECIES: FAD-dependent oxidoreductase [Mycolicibacterium]MCV7336095.1 FAD-dependent oxidoreductase [Mycolicibacterium senegalense]MDR7287898.1 NADPH-dependent 2,4-dienoyl-CoA reductase/sulfur reductase-like enzyme [Mycolicibacterium senegalense]QZA24903.1 FAD-dependent oxidoreductase [Mycolicibacterium senegalense]CDP86695.1 FAD-dependent pyridine nucleotide-disulfide oxidoreductase [Mycolicibacterium farcinogenes]SUA28526.1 FAD-dependent pyridine nucleotide-disulfide oxidoreductase [M
MTIRQVTIVGGSVAGLRTAQALRRKGFDGVITVLDADREPAIQRPALSKRFLTSPLTASDIRLHTDGDSIDVRRGVRVVGFDLNSRLLRIREGDAGADRTVPVDGLVIATGAVARTLPLPSMPGVHVLRTLADAQSFRADLTAGPRVVIIGAGFIGSEVASSCRNLGLDVTLVGSDAVPMSRTLGEAVGGTLVGLHRDHGTKLRLGVGVDGFVGADRVTGVRLANGEIVPADVVLVGVGSRPAVDWLHGSGLELADGVLCRGNLAAAERIVAVGDVARWQPLRGGSVRIEHWDNAVRQAEVAAATLIDPAAGSPYTATTMFWSDQYDCKLHLIGHSEPGDDFAVIEGGLDDRRFVGAYTKAGRLNAVLLCNQPHRLKVYRTAVENGALPATAADGTAVG